MRPALPALLFGATCIALSPIFVRLSDVGPTVSAFWRVALAAPLLWLLWIVSSRPSLQGSKPLFLCAALAFTGDLVFWHWSIQYTSVANSTLLANLSSIFVTLVVWVLWRQRPTVLFLIGLGAALAGVLMLVRTSLDFSPTGLLGDALGVVTAMFYAWYILSVKGLRDRGATTLHLITVSTTLTAVFLFPLALVSGEVLFPAGVYGWAVLVGLAWVSQAAGQGLIAYSLAHLPAAFSSVGLLLQPVIAALIAWSLLGEPLAGLQIAGGAMVLFGIWLARRGSAA